MENLNKFVAKALNLRWGKWENFWAPGSYDAKRCVSVEDALERMAYTIANPTAAGLVETPEEWPGFVTMPEDVGKRRIVARRPSIFFRPDGKMPEEVSLIIEPLRCDDPDKWPADKQTEVLREKVNTRVAAAYEKYDGSFLGAKKVLAASHLDQPRKPSPRFQTSMRIAAHDTVQRIEAIEERKEFLHGYEIAKQGWKEGDTTVAFPPGTWWFRHHTPARVQKPPHRVLLS